MNQEQVNQLVGMIQAIDGKIEAFKDEVRNRFDALEQRMTNVEGAAARIAGPRDQRGGWSSKSTGSKENATYLPYAIEHIAKKYQQRSAGDKRHW
jgi:hypothetical protein